MKKYLFARLIEKPPCLYLEHVFSDQPRDANLIELATKVVRDMKTQHLVLKCQQGLEIPLYLV